MPKYYDFKVAGYYLYFTSHCIVEAMHVHASNSKLTEEGSAKFFVKNNGDSDVSQKGLLNEREIKDILTCRSIRKATWYQISGRSLKS